MLQLLRYFPLTRVISSSIVTHAKPTINSKPATLQCITHEGHDHLRSIVWALNNPICLRTCRYSDRRALEETKLQLVQSPSSTSPSKIYCSLPPYWRKPLYFNHLERPLKITQNHNKVPSNVDSPSFSCPSTSTHQNQSCCIKLH